MRRGIRDLFRIALADLWGEWVLSLCLVVAVAAVTTPILVLASMKVGFVDRLRAELIADPSFRELLPGDAQPKPPEFFNALETSPLIEFVAPSTMMVPREVVWRVEGQRDRAEARLMPSGHGDPLLAGAPPLGPDEALISDTMAVETGVEPGGTIEIIASRILPEGRQSVVTPLVVRGTYPAQQMQTPAIISNPALDAEVEGWRAGLPAPRLGWEGVRTPMRTRYRAIHLATREPLDAFATEDLLLRLGASAVEPMTWDDYLAELGATADPDAPGASLVHYRLTRTRDAFGASDVAAMPGILQGRTALASGWTPPAETPEGLVAFADFRLLRDVCAPLCLERDAEVYTFDDLALHGTPDDGRRVLPVGDGTVEVSIPELALPATAAMTEPEPESEPTADTDPATTPASADSPAPADATALADWRLGGVLARALEVPLSYDPELNRLYEDQIGTRGFRAVAADLDSVVGAAELIRAQGFAVISKENAVRRLQRLDLGLNILVGVVSGVALVGGFAVIGITFFANVQRKAAMFAVLRLLGARRRFVFFHPVVQCFVVVLAGYALSLAVFQGISVFINGWVVDRVGFEGTLSVLRAEHYALMLGLLLAGSLFSSVALARQAMRIDPALALKANV